MMNENLPKEKESSNGPTNITYKITTIQELADVVTSENVERLVADLTVWLHTIAGLKPYGAKDFGTLKWTDDGNAVATSTIYNTERTNVLFTMKTKLEDK